MASAMCGLLVAAVLAAAPPDTATARQLFDAGSLAYDRGRYGDAAKAFEAAYALLPDPAIAFSTAQAHRRRYFVARERGDLERAIELYSVYLREVPEGRRREDAVDQLQSLETLRARLSDTPDPVAAATEVQGPSSTQLMVYGSTAGAEVSIDDAGFAAVPVIVDVTPGAHDVVVQAPGFVTEHTTATAIAGRLMPVPVGLREQPAMLRLRTNPRATIAVDGREVGRAPLAKPVELSSGAHEVKITAPGRVSASRVLAFDRGQVRDVSVELPRTRQRVAAWAMIGTSAGLWLAGGTTLGLAFGYQRRAREIDDLRGEENIDTAQLVTLEDSLRLRDGMRSATIALWTGAAVTGVVGLVLMVTDRG